jgi:CheY-like chemotaxis protein
MTIQTIKKIFLADDDIDDCVLFEDALRELQLETQLTIANDGVELMHTLDKDAFQLPDVIFLDLNMPRKDGFECLKEIKQNSQLKDIPVVIFSTSSSSDIINKTYHGGADCYISKPRSFSLLKKAIETVLSMGKPNTRPSKDHFVLKIA